MTVNRKHVLILMIIIGAALIICAASAQDVSAAKTKKTTVKINNYKPGELWASKAKILKNGDAIAGYVLYKDNSQFTKGTGVNTWYYGSGYDGDIEPHHTKLVKVKFFFKNKNGKVKTKTVKGSGAHIRTNLINGYTPYKATVWYTAY